MLKHRANRDRIINYWPMPYNVLATPYENQKDFNPQVKEACGLNKIVTTGLKISKAIFIGDVGVGKTSLVNRFCHEIFDKDYKATIGVDFEVERFEILQVPYNLQIWDTAGQERFKCIASSYYRGAHLIIIVCDLTDLLSIQNSSRWLEDAMVENSGEPIKFLVGTKRDLCLDATSSVIEKQAIAISQKLNAEFWSVSAKTGENVQNLFFRMAALAFNASVMREVEGISPTIQIGSNLIKLDNNNVFERKGKDKCVYNSCKL